MKIYQVFFMIALGLFLGWGIINIAGIGGEKKKAGVLEFDEKYSKICDENNLSYLEAELYPKGSHTARCFKTNGDFLLEEYKIIERGGRYYFKRE